MEPIEGLDLLAGNDDALAACPGYGWHRPTSWSPRHRVGAEMRRTIDEPDARARIPARSAPCTRPSASRRCLACVKAPRELLATASGTATPAVRGSEPIDQTALLRTALDYQGLLERGIPLSGTLRILSLGGLGEIRKNMTVVEYDGRIVVVDTGLRFPTPDQMGVDLVLPDFAYLRERRRHRRDYADPRPRGPRRRAPVRHP